MKNDNYQDSSLDNNLEKIISPEGNSLEYDTAEEKTSKKVTSSKLKSYVVDTTSSWLYWTPVMTFTELCSGMEAEEIVNSRLMAMGLALGIARPHGMFRQYWADLWKADANSSKKKKAFVDITANACFQAPIYSAILYFSGVSLEEGVAALATGLTIGAIGSRPFGYVQDKWRKLWGTKPTLDD